MLTGLLITLNVLVCIGLVAVVLLQRSEGGAFGMGGGPTGLVTARGAGDLLTRTTWILFSLFLVLSLALTLLGAHDRATSSMLDKLKLQKADPNAINHIAPAVNAIAPPAPSNAASPFLAPPPASAAPPAAAAPAPTTAPPPSPAAATPTPPKPAKPTPAAAHETPPKPAPTHAAAAPAPAAATPATPPPPPVLEAPAPAAAPVAPATPAPQ
jgi:preprotein translocase subunit SecG